MAEAKLRLQTVSHEGFELQEQLEQAKAKAQAPRSKAHAQEAVHQVLGEDFDELSCSSLKASVDLDKAIEPVTISIALDDECCVKYSEVETLTTTVGKVMRKLRSNNKAPEMVAILDNLENIVDGQTKLAQCNEGIEARITKAKTKTYFGGGDAESTPFCQRSGGIRRARFACCAQIAHTLPLV